MAALNASPMPSKAKQTAVFGAKARKKASFAAQCRSSSTSSSRTHSPARANLVLGLAANATLMDGTSAPGRTSCTLSLVLLWAFSTPLMARVLLGSLESILRRQNHCSKVDVAILRRQLKLPEPWRPTRGQRCRRSRPPCSPALSGGRSAPSSSQPAICHGGRGVCLRPNGSLTSSRSGAFRAGALIEGRAATLLRMPFDQNRSGRPKLSLRPACDLCFPHAAGASRVPPRRFQC